MMSSIKSLETIKAMQDCDLSLNHTKQFTPVVILDACRRIKELDPEINLDIAQKERIQKEIIQNPDFLMLYRDLIRYGMSSYYINQWIQTADEFEEPLTLYSAELIEEAFKLFEFADYEQPATKSYYGYSNSQPKTRDIKIRYEYMKRLYPLIKSQEDQQIVIENINAFNTQNKFRISQLTDEECKLFLKPYFAKHLYFRTGQPDQMIQYISSNEVIQFLLHFVWDKNIEYCFNSDEIYLLREITDVNLQSFLKVFDVLEQDSEDMELFLERWLENKAPIYDLKWFAKQSDPMPAERRRKILETQLGYLNCLYADSIGNNIPFEKIEDYKRDVLIYAINNGKRAFIRLISANLEQFMDMDHNAMIFDPEFYCRCNLNSLTLQDLKNSKGRCRESSHLKWLENKEYTFEELRILRYAEKPYYHFYAKLNMLRLRVDERIIRIRQMLKHNLLSTDLSDQAITNLAQKLEQKTLDRWRDTDFVHLQGMKSSDLVRCLTVYDDIKRFLPDMTHWEEAVYAARNSEDLKNYMSWRDVLKNLMENDNDWLWIRNEFGINDQFVNQNKNSIIHYLIHEGAEMTRLYYQNIQNKEAFRRIVRAELMGKFRTLKYYEDDLRKEISYPIGEAQRKIWMLDSSMRSEDNIEVFEAADFYSTLRIGEVPQRTCLSYIDGVHRECLLSAYDSNKKIIYAQKNGVLVGRAFIRLTKGSFYPPQKGARFNGAFEFVDLQCTTKKEKYDDTNELLTLFLELPYFRGVSKKSENEILRMFMDIVEEKAKKLNAIAVLNTRYIDAALENAGYLSVGYYLYISKSKGGAQYLDSLNGETSVTDEGSYRKGIFCIKEKYTM